MWTVAQLEKLEAQRHRLFLAERAVHATPEGNMESRSRVVHTWHRLADDLTEAGVFAPPADWKQSKCQELTPAYSVAIMNARLDGLLV